MNSYNVWNPGAIVKNLWCYRELIKQFAKRDVIGRYKGSYLGIVWSFLTPLFMLCIYTFVFSVVFKSRWGVGTGSKVEFALVLFCGLTTFNLFGECINRAPALVLNNVNYVKKVIFPLEILPVAVMVSALVQAVINLFILTAGLIILMGVFNWTLIFLPLVLLPLLLFTLGLSWFLASLGVYLRDIGQVVTVATQVLMFLSPIFYPVSAVPERFRLILNLNPLCYVVEDMRRIIVWGQLPEWKWLILGTIAGLIVDILGYAWFQKTRKGFADVI